MFVFANADHAIWSSSRFWMTTTGRRVNAPTVGSLALAEANLAHATVDDLLWELFGRGNKARDDSAHEVLVQDALAVGPCAGTMFTLRVVPQLVSSNRVRCGR